MMDTTYRDDLADRADCEQLWQAVLSLTINDAVQGTKMGGDSRLTRVRLIQEARDYITNPNRDFNEVCTLAGMDPEAVRERLRPIIAKAPSPEELAGEDRWSRQRRRANEPEHTL